MQEDYIDANFKFQSYIQLDTVRKEAGLSFSLKFVGKIVNFGEDFSAKAAWVKQTEETRNTTLETIRRQSRVRSVGGPNVHLLMAVDGKVLILLSTCQRFPQNSRNDSHCDDSLGIHGRQSGDPGKRWRRSILAL